MKRIITVLLFGLCFAVPVLALAQDTPTAEEPTLAPTEFVTETAVPTEEPTATPVPPVEPEEPPPPPTDWNLIIPWIGAAILVICIGGFTVLRTALVQLGRSIPLPAWEVGKSTTNSLYDQLMKLFGRTETPVDDYLGAEGRKLLDSYFKEVEELRARLNVVESQAARNAENIAQTAQIVQRNPPPGQPSHT
jgi:hypothetical protein